MHKHHALSRQPSDSVFLSPTASSAGFWVIDPSEYSARKTVVDVLRRLSSSFDLANSIAPSPATSARSSLSSVPFSSPEKGDHMFDPNALEFISLAEQATLPELKKDFGCGKETVGLDAYHSNGKWLFRDQEGTAHHCIGFFIDSGNQTWAKFAYEGRTYKAQLVGSSSQPI